MKTIKFILSAILMMMALTVYAQERVVQVYKDGKVIKEYSVSEVASVTTQAQSEQKVEASNASTSVGFSISSSPKLEIGADKLTFSNNANSVNFSADERLVIRLKPAKQDDASSTKKGDVNGDGKVNITDVTTLVNIVLSQPAEAAAKAKRTVEE